MIFLLVELDLAVRYDGRKIKWTGVYDRYRKKTKCVKGIE